MSHVIAALAPVAFTFVILALSREIWDLIPKRSDPPKPIETYTNSLPKGCQFPECRGHCYVTSGCRADN